MLVPDTVGITTLRIPAFLMQETFSSVWSKELRLRNQSWVLRIPSKPLPVWNIH